MQVRDTALRLRPGSEFEAALNGGPPEVELSGLIASALEDGWWIDRDAGCIAFTAALYVI